MQANFRSFLKANRISGSAVGRAIGLDPSQMSRRLNDIVPFSVDEASGALEYVSGVLGHRVTFEEAFGPAAAEPELVGRDHGVSA